MKNSALTLTVIARMTSNYSEGLGNVSSVQKVYRDGRVYATRSRESMKNALMVQGGLYDDLEVSVDGATQKRVDEQLNASNCRALEGGYMNTSGITAIRKSSFYLTDAVSCEEFINETRFHNNLYLASTFARHNDLNLQKDAGKAGLMPYQYEFDKSLKIYSLTIDLERVGIDENYKAESKASEKAARVTNLLRAVEHLSLVVKGNLDNAEPVFVVGGLSPYKTHIFENVVKVDRGELQLTQDLVDRLAKGYAAGLLEGDNFTNEAIVKETLEPKSIAAFFDELCQAVNDYYGV